MGEVYIVVGKLEESPCEHIAFETFVWPDQEGDVAKHVMDTFPEIGHVLRSKRSSYSLAVGNVYPVSIDHYKRMAYPVILSERSSPKHSTISQSIREVAGTLGELFYAVSRHISIDDTNSRLALPHGFGRNHSSFGDIWEYTYQDIREAMKHKPFDLYLYVDPRELEKKPVEPSSTAKYTIEVPQNITYNRK